MRGLRPAFVPWALLAWSSAVLASQSTTPPASEAPAARHYFFVGGNYISTVSGTLLVNQMYVEKLSITKPSQKYPLVLVHGQAQTGSVHDHTPPIFFEKCAADARFLELANKPDGGTGWRHISVYIIGQTERARSAWYPARNTTMATYSAEIIEQRFTAVEKVALWPQAQLHTQWPGVRITLLLISLI